MLKSFTKISGSKEVKVSLYADGRAYVTAQKINPATGRGWQKRTDFEMFDNHAKAMRAFAMFGLKVIKAK